MREQRGRGWQTHNDGVRMEPGRRLEDLRVGCRRAWAFIEGATTEIGTSWFQRQPDVYTIRLRTFSVCFL